MNIDDYVKDYGDDGDSNADANDNNDIMRKKTTGTIVNEPTCVDGYFVMPAACMARLVLRSRAQDSLQLPTRLTLLFIVNGTLS